MATFTTFYLSRILDKTVYDANKRAIGVVKDLLVNNLHASERPLVEGVVLKTREGLKNFSFANFVIIKRNRKIKIKCYDALPFSEDPEKFILLKDNFLDKQIVDINGRKLVRVNDVRMISINGNTFVIAVDIGVEGLLRRIGISRQVNSLLKLFKAKIPGKFILWEDVAAVDSSSRDIKLSKQYSKLQTLHPSDLADIFEEMGKKSVTEVFSSLDEEKAADVLEELETDTQIQIIESLPEEKVADVLEKMPADEVAAILDELSHDKAERLLNVMESESSDEVRELLHYPDNSVGSIMSTDVFSFSQNFTVDEILKELRQKKPEQGELYNLFAVNDKDKLCGTFSLRDVVISEPSTMVQDIMKPSPAHLNVMQPIGDIAEIISKYNLLAVPVVDDNSVLQGMVVIDDVLEDLIETGRTNK